MEDIIMASLPNKELNRLIKIEIQVRDSCTWYGRFICY